MWILQVLLLVKLKCFFSSPSGELKSSSATNNFLRRDELLSTSVSQQEL
ncbi:hypothetical protein X975_16846, partial [Stegodyphus mimosarum]